MRRTRFVSYALVGLVLTGCGAQSTGESGSAGPTVALTTPTAVATSVDLGSDPRLAPVERVLSSLKGRFDAGMFLSAFDVTAQPCGIVGIARRLQGHNAQAPLDVNAARLVSLRSHGASGAVALSDPQRYYVRLGQVRGKWVVNENACMWIASVDGGDLSASITKGLAALGPNDPRRVPATALIDSLTSRFDASKFLSAFDLGDQPCDASSLARSAEGSGNSSEELHPRFFAQPIGPGDVGILVSAQGQVVPLHERVRDGQWRLDEDACTWLTLVLRAPGAARDEGVRSDLRNALTAEKTIYVDNQEYSSSPATMQMIEPSLDWGGRLQINVGDASAPGDHNVICLAESSPSGKTYAIADVAAGPDAGTYYAAHACPAPLTAAAVARLGDSF